MQLIFPIRINRYLALKQYCSRRQADKLIEQNKIRINGKLAKIGDKVNAEDEVIIDQKTSQKIAHNRVYLAYYKSIGLNTQDIPEKIQKKDQVFPVGRLDKNSHGLIILTNDGRITNRLLNPEFDHDKEYVVRVDKKITDSALNRMRKGVNIENEHTRPAEIIRLGDNNFRIILTEGKHHQIRRMCSALGYTVRDLKRVRIMNIKLGAQKPGTYRQIKNQELTNLLNALQISSDYSSTCH